MRKLLNWFVVSLGWGISPNAMSIIDSDNVEELIRFLPLLPRALDSVFRSQAMNDQYSILNRRNGQKASSIMFPHATQYLSWFLGLLMISSSIILLLDNHGRDMDLSAMFYCTFGAMFYPIGIALRAYAQHGYAYTRCCIYQMDTDKEDTVIAILDLYVWNLLLTNRLADKEQTWLSNGILPMETKVDLTKLDIAQLSDDNLFTPHAPKILSESVQRYRVEYTSRDGSIVIGTSKRDVSRLVQLPIMRVANVLTIIGIIVTIINTVT